MKAFCRSILLALVLGLLAACSNKGAEPTASAPTTPPAATSDTQAQAEPTKAAPTKAEPTKAKPTAAPTKAEPTAESKKAPLTVDEFGFGQDKQSVGFAFKVTNNNKGLAVENTEYQVAAYDKAGKVLKTESGYIDLLLPEQTLGVAGSTYLDGENDVIDKIEVQISEGTYSSTEPLPTFETEQVAYIPDDFIPQVAGVVKSPYSKDVDTVRVSAIGYDDAGKIISSGYTYVNFIPAKGQSAVMMSMTGPAPAKVELYAAISGISAFAEEPAAGVTPIELTAQGYGLDGQEIGYGFIVKNDNQDQSVESSQYNVAAYAEDGSVISVDEGYVSLLLPGQELGLGGTMYIGEGKTPSKVVVQVLSGRAEKAEALAPFTTENATFQPSDFSKKVTGSVKSPYKQDVKNVRVSALAFDDAGKIIGGGYTYVEFVPAEGDAAAEVSVAVDGTPAKVELYAAVSGLSDFEQ